MPSYTFRPRSHSLVPSQWLSSPSTDSSHIPSWNTTPTPPSTPYLGPVPLPECCPHHPPPAVHGIDSSLPHVHRALQEPYNLLVAPNPQQEAWYAAEPATYPPTHSLTLRVVVNPYLLGPLCALEILLASETSSPITILDIHNALTDMLRRQVSYCDMAGLCTERYDIVCGVFYERTRGDMDSLNRGVCWVDWIGGACILRGLTRSQEEGVWEAWLDVSGNDPDTL